jgi:hypothetical protein
MALVIADRVKETSTTTGTGTFTLGGAVAGYQAFSVIGNGNQCYYTIVGIAVASEWEVGVGTYSSSTITRDIVLSSSTGGAKVSFSAGNKEVFVTYPADRSVSQADVGTAPNEIPLNQYLGSLAYQNLENVIVGNVNVGGALTVTGTSTVQEGTAALPSITPTGDTNTGLFFPAADTIAFSEGGVEAMRIDSAGNVGVGTTANASALLDVQSTTKGVRMPNMTTTQKNAIASPAAGLMVFDTTLSKLSVYSGVAWETVTSI